MSMSLKQSKRQTSSVASTPTSSPNRITFTSMPSCSVTGGGAAVVGSSSCMTANVSPPSSPLHRNAVVASSSYGRHHSTPPPPPLDPYHVLEVRRDATKREIRDAYRRLALLHHPRRTLGSNRNNIHLLTQQQQQQQQQEQKDVDNDDVVSIASWTIGGKRRRKAVSLDEQDLWALRRRRQQQQQRRKEEEEEREIREWKFIIVSASFETLQNDSSRRRYDSLAKKNKGIHNNIQLASSSEGGGREHIIFYPHSFGGCAGGGGGDEKQLAFMTPTRGNLSTNRGGGCAGGPYSPSVAASTTTSASTTTAADLNATSAGALACGVPPSSSRVQTGGGGSGSSNSSSSTNSGGSKRGPSVGTRFRSLNDNPPTTTNTAATAGKGAGVGSKNIFQCIQHGAGQLVVSNFSDEDDSLVSSSEEEEEDVNDADDDENDVHDKDDNDENVAQNNANNVDTLLTNQRRQRQRQARKKKKKKERRNKNNDKIINGRHDDSDDSDNDGGGRHYTTAETNSLFGGPLSLMYQARNHQSFADPYVIFRSVFKSDLFHNPRCDDDGQMNGRGRGGGNGCYYNTRNGMDGNPMERVRRRMRDKQNRTLADKSDHGTDEGDADENGGDGNGNGGCAEIATKTNAHAGPMNTAEVLCDKHKLKDRLQQMSLSSSFGLANGDENNSSGNKKEKKSTTGMGGGSGCHHLAINPCLHSAGWTTPPPSPRSYDGTITTLRHRCALSSSSGTAGGGGGGRIVASMSQPPPFSSSAWWTGSTETKPDGTVISTTVRIRDGRKIIRTETTTVDAQTGKKKTVVEVTREDLPITATTAATAISLSGEATSAASRCCKVDQEKGHMKDSDKQNTSWLLCGGDNESSSDVGSAFGCCGGIQHSESDTKIDQSVITRSGTAASETVGGGIEGTNSIKSKSSVVRTEHAEATSPENSTANSFLSKLDAIFGKSHVSNRKGTGGIDTGGKKRDPCEQMKQLLCSCGPIIP